LPNTVFDLGQKTDADPVCRPGLADKLLVLAGHDPQQCALAGAVQAEHADFRAWQERQPDILQDDMVGRVNLPEPFHGVDELHGVTGELRIADC
jgi:hypothetical protein